MARVFGSDDVLESSVEVKLGNRFLEGPCSEAIRILSVDPSVEFWSRIELRIGSLKHAGSKVSDRSSGRLIGPWIQLIPN